MWNTKEVTMICLRRPGKVAKVQSSGTRGWNTFEYLISNKISKLCLWVEVVELETIHRTQNYINSFELSRLESEG